MGGGGGGVEEGGVENASISSHSDRIVEGERQLCVHPPGQAGLALETAVCAPPWSGWFGFRDSCVCTPLVRLVWL